MQFIAGTCVDLEGPRSPKIFTHTSDIFDWFGTVIFEKTTVSEHETAKFFHYPSCLEWESDTLR